MLLLIKKPLEHKKMHKALPFTPAIGWGILVLYLSLTPGDKLPDALVALNDKFLHGFIYFFSAFLIYLAFIQYRFQNVLTRKQMVIILVICVVFGGLIELAQAYLVPRRKGDWYDFAANTCGAILSIVLMRLTHRFMKKRIGA